MVGYLWKVYVIVAGPSAFVNELHVELEVLVIAHFITFKPP